MAGPQFYGGGPDLQRAGALNLAPHKIEGLPVTIYYPDYHACPDTQAIFIQEEQVRGENMRCSCSKVITYIACDLLRIKRQ